MDQDPQPPERLPTWWPLVTSLVLLGLGSWGFVYEVTNTTTDRPWLLALIGGMLGLVPASVIDWARKRGS